MTNVKIKERLIIAGFCAIIRIDGFLCYGVRTNIKNINVNIIFIIEIRKDLVNNEKILFIVHNFTNNYDFIHKCVRRGACNSQKTES